MKQWKLFYKFSSEFTDPVKEHYYKLRCFPREYSMQRISFLKWEMQPQADGTLVSDPFGNRLLYGHCSQPHDYFEAAVDAVVSREALPEPEPVPAYRFGMLRSPTRQTAMGESLLDFYAGIGKNENDAPWDRAAALMSEVYGAFAYVTASTSFSTTAEEAFAQGCGVCQDYAHILLALLRHEHLTARYAAGTIPGEGQTHAWVEVYDSGFWKGFDPTHNKETDDEYISFAVGRDALDCGLNRGIFKNAYEKSQHVIVKMEEF